MLFAWMTFHFALQSNGIKELVFFTGTWKVENKESYETWRINDDGSLEGFSYKIKAGEKQVTESLTIKEHKDHILYTAKVPNQNNGQPVDFKWNKAVKDKFSFENEAHDFPKKVQYTKLNDTTLFVSVLGDHDKGFSYKLFKQKPVKSK